MLIIKINAMWKNVNKKGKNFPILCVPRNNHQGLRSFKYLSEHICK